MALYRLYTQTNVFVYDWNDDIFSFSTEVMTFLLLHVLCVYLLFVYFVSARLLLIYVLMVTATFTERRIGVVAEEKILGKESSFF